ncbi:hypothetical protein [Nocardia sp. NPDC004860]|uniref:hypothetical protein n=1 Tax=Nocardia sp. NPDC004860 TaxID=3154557 RepID=UPI0033A37082
MTAVGQAAWDGLNERQRIYLGVLFRVDQELGGEQRRLAARGRFASAPACVWRRVDFNNRYGPVVSVLETQGVYDGVPDPPWLRCASVG